MNVLFASICSRSPGVGRYEADGTGPRHRPLVSNDARGTSFFQEEDLFRVVVLVKRDSLPRCHGLGQNEKILSVPVLAVELDGERPAASRTRPPHEVITVTFLQNERAGRCGTLRSLVFRLWSGALAHSGVYKYCNRHGRQHHN